MTCKPTISYPFFIPNQILSSRDLNSIVEHLDQQNRITRSYLFGMGILYGLDLKWEENPSRISISRGVGLSSQGFLFDNESIELLSYEEVEIDADELMCEEDINNTTPDSFTMWELLDDDSGIAIDQIFSKEELDDIVIMLFWDQEQNIQEASFSQCSDPRGQINVATRILAISKEDAELITKLSFAERPSDEELPTIHLPRFGFKEGAPSEIQPKNIKDLGNFVENYQAICAKGIKDPTSLASDIITAYTTIGERFAEILEQSETFTDLETHLTGGTITIEKEENGTTTQEDITVEGLVNQVVGKNDGKGIQYLYDFLKDLKLAYMEFADTRFAHTLTKEYDGTLFPNHILLGRFHNNQETGSVDLFEDCRTDLIQPPIEGMGDKDIDKARYLYVRMVKLTERSYDEESYMASFTHVNLPLAYPEEENYQEPAIKITPSRSKSLPLSTRAIPYYYTKESVSEEAYPLRMCWSYEEMERKRVRRIPAYYPITALDANGVAVPIIKEHLLFDMDAYNFFRIEGHLFKDLDTALEDIETQRARLNLPFDLQYLRLELEVNPELETEDMQDLSVHNLEMRDLELNYQKCRLELLCAPELKDNTVVASIQLRTFLEGAAKLADFTNQYDGINSGFEALYDAVFPPANVETDCVRLNMKAYFRSLKDAYTDRYNEVKDLLNFPDFVEQHPGLEHCAGVPKGGTFFLLYIDYISDADEDTLKGLLTNQIEDPQSVGNNPGANAPISNSFNQGNYSWWFGYGHSLWPGAANVSFQQYLNVLASAGNLSINESISQEEYDNYSTTKAGLIYLARKYDVGTNLIKKEVIGDFSLPYFCCSATPPVLSETKTPPIILLSPKHFCQSSDQVPITVLPEGGSFAKSQWVIKKEGSNSQYNFDPSAVPLRNFTDFIAKVPIAYVYDGKTASTEATVYWQPTAAFEIVEMEPIREACTIDGFNYLFESRSVLQLRDGDMLIGESKPIPGSHIQWIINDVNEGTGDSKEYPVNFADQEFPISIRVRIIASRADMPHCQGIYTETIEIPCPTMEIVRIVPQPSPIFGGPVITDETSPTGETITVFSYPLSANSEFRSVDLQIANHYSGAVLQITQFLPDGPATGTPVTSLKDYLIGPTLSSASGMEACAFSFTYQFAQDPENSLPEGLYRFDYVLSTCDPIVLWIRLVPPEEEVPEPLELSEEVNTPVNTIILENATESTAESVTDSPNAESSPILEATVEAPTEEATTETIEEVVEAPVEAPTEEGVTETVEEVVETPVETPAEEITTETVEEVVETPVETPAEEITTETIEEVVETPVATPAERSVPDDSEEETNGFITINQRRSARAEKLAELATDSSLTSTSAYQESKAFDLLDGREVSRLEIRFQNVSNLLVKNRGSKRATELRKRQYSELLEINLHGFLDKLAIASPNKVPDSARIILRETLSKMEAGAIDLQQIWNDWNAAELKEATNATAIDELEELFTNR